MIRSICLAGIICIFAGTVIAQEQQTAGTKMEQGLRRRALEININARTFDDEQVVIWEQTEKRVTLPGNPVGIKLVGSNLVVAVQFTPFIRRQGNVLVAQGQIWIDNQDSGGVSHYTSIQTIPMDFNEPIYFFPLGTSNSSIEIIVTVNHLTENDISEASSAAKNEN